MECIFRGLDTKQCFTHQKCAGVENLILQMGGSRSFALGFARYAFRTSLLNKLKDSLFESQYNYILKPESIGLKIKYLGFKLLDSVAKRIVGNSYSIQKRYTNLENRVFRMEFIPERYTPIEYCEHAGAGYGFFFYWAAIGSAQSKAYAQTMFEYGKKLGTIVTLRDAIKDYDIDKKFHKYNPFHHMKKEEVLPYFRHNIQILQGEIQNIQNSVSNTILKQIPSQNAFDAVIRYTMQSQSFCAKCARDGIISSLNTPATKTVAGVLASIVAVVGINSACNVVAASGGGPISSILQTEGNCCDRCSQRCAESCCQSCCDRCSTNCNNACDNSSCRCDTCTCSNCGSGSPTCSCNQ